MYKLIYISSPIINVVFITLICCFCVVPVALRFSVVLAAPGLSCQCTAVMHGFLSLDQGERCSDKGSGLVLLALLESSTNTWCRASR